CLDALAQGMDWELGVLWQVCPGGGDGDPADRQLRCVHVCSRAGEEAGKLEQLCRQTILRPGIELPGRVWQTGLPAVVLELENEQQPRAQAAVEADLPAAIAFAVRGVENGAVFPGGGANPVLGVFEFFTHGLEPLTPPLAKLLTALGSQ